MASVILIGLVAAAVLLVRKHSLESKKYLDAGYLENLSRILECLAMLDQFDDYLTWIQRDEIKFKYATTAKFFKNKTAYYKKEKNVERFNAIFDDFDGYVADYNKKYVAGQKEKLKQYFDDIEGKQLDDQQRNAVITDEYSNLIIAGAGSGKTLTILGKVKYLIEKKNVNPDEILLLSFTKKTVEELSARIRDIGLTAEANTFHKLGYDTIKQFYPDAPAVTNDNTLKLVVKEYLQNDIFNDPIAMESYVLYVACYMNIPEDNYDSLGEKLDTEKGIDFHTLKSKSEQLNKIAAPDLDTLQGEKVKSVEELTIANFLYLNGIEYEYEKPYPYQKTVYRPDFYLKDYDIRLEHFGVDENNRAKWLTAHNEQKYVEEMELKRRIHKENDTRLLETYSYYNRDKILLERLTEMLEKENVVFVPRDSTSIYRKITENDEKFGSEIVKLIESFINLSKSRRLDAMALNSLLSDRSHAKNDFMYERQKIFLQFVLPILAKYDHVLKEKNEIDFNDMINKATDAVQKHKPDYKYRYVIIDEYQDISVSRFNLVKEIRDLTRARLICVGDDWQSIYRFAGSDISLFRNFEKYVGKSEKLLIEQTHRNSQQLIDISAKFIQKNKMQIPKWPKSKKDFAGNPVKFVHYDSDMAEETFLHEVGLLSDKYQNKSILVLGRHGFDVDELIKSTGNNQIKYFEKSGKLEVKGFEYVAIRFLTVHKSKGLEADNVIVLNLRNHLLGFPNKMTDDPILSLLLNDDEEYRFAEERRLFYVALTRTRNEAVLLIPSDQSLFAGELLADNDYLMTADNGNLETVNCPYCQTGKLVIRINSISGSQFLGCSHFPACNQTFNSIAILENSILCRYCKSGFMVKRTGKFGDFLGCTNYPECNETINI